MLARQTRVDASTGLLNRPSWEAAVDGELRRFKRSGAAASLMMIDIDRFKEINDRHGHPAGDRVLRHLAETLLHNIRRTDTAARYAGDEFLLVLPDTNLDGATELARRIRAQFGEAIVDPAGGRCTISLGAAEAYEDMADVEDWIQQADSALYRAKEGGRDQIVSAPKIIAPPARAAHGASAIVDEEKRDKPRAA
jgi:diguanylate cyclase